MKSWDKAQVSTSNTEYLPCSKEAAARGTMAKRSDAIGGVRKSIVNHSSTWSCAVHHSIAQSCSHRKTNVIGIQSLASSCCEVTRILKAVY